jgi:hypothetical protein
VDFGLLSGPAVREQTVALANLGTCPLTIHRIGLADADRGFGCAVCDGPFPLEVLPGRRLELDLGFLPGAAGAWRTELAVRSDDPELPLLRVPVKATYQGAPRVLAAPAAVDFGYLAQGRQAVRQVLLANAGTGTAAAVVEQVSVEPAEGTDFSVDAGTLPRPLASAGPGPRQVLPVEVRFRPRAAAPSSAVLLVATSQGVVRVPLLGTAAAPPVAVLSPPALDLGEVTPGETATATLTLVNQGGAPLSAAVRWAWGGSTDLAVAPARLVPVAPGAFAELTVALTPTLAGPVAAILALDTDDPAHPTLAVPVRATAVPGRAAAVVKVDVTVAAGAAGALTDDVRAVEATLESPGGQACSRGAPAQGWGPWGDCTFLGLGSSQRFVLVNAAEDGAWRVLATYTQDCAALPTALAASILGLSLDALQRYLAGGKVVVPGQDIGQVLEGLCLYHLPAAVSVRVSVDGATLTERTATLGTKGTSEVLLELRRTRGAFAVGTP